MNVFRKASLTNLFSQIESRTVTYFDWHSAQGEAFLEAVDSAVASGIDVNEIGSMIGVRDFSQRYKILRRGKVVQGNHGIEGVEHAAAAVLGELSPMRACVEAEGRAGAVGWCPPVLGLQEES